MAMEADSTTGAYRTPSGALSAEWVVEEADLHAGAKAAPAATSKLVRWPLAFFIAYVGVALSTNRDDGSGVFAAVAPAIVLAGGMVVLLLGARGSALRRAARLPLEQRTKRLLVDDQRIRLEAASGHVTEYPLAELTHARFAPSGVLLNIKGEPLFVPQRAMALQEDAWRARLSPLATRPWPSGVGCTVVLLLFALAVALYGFVT
jgi:hypothetical protein